MSLEAAVRHHWDALAAPGVDSTGLNLVYAIFTAVAKVFTPSTKSPLLDGRTSLMQYVTDSSKSPALLSLLLSCLKQVQHSCQCNPQDALRMVGMSSMAAVIATRFVTTSSERPHDTSGDSSSTDGVAASSSTGRVAASNNPACSSSTAQERTPHSEPSALSSELGNQSQAALSNGFVRVEHQQAKLTLQLTAEGIIPAGSTWLLLFGRVLYTTGVALQAVTAAVVPPPDTSMAVKVGLLPVPRSAGFLLSSVATAMPECGEMLCFYMAADTAASVVGRSAVQATLHVPAVITRVMKAYSDLLDGLVAAAHHAKQLEEAAGTTGSAVDVSSTPTAEGQQGNTSDIGIWQQVLGSEQGRQLPQALMDVGSLLCAALPSRSCCNEPSCCSFSKPSELQLAGGKGTKCSGCGVARYCSVAHQRLHWKQHKPACRAIAAATAAAAEASKLTAPALAPLC
jgi:hypothetical protein